LVFRTAPGEHRRERGEELVTRGEARAHSAGEVLEAASVVLERRVDLLAELNEECTRREHVAAH
jgi:hypothetical protein